MGGARRAPDALEREGVPAGAAAIGQRARTAAEGAGLGVGGGVLALVVLAVVVEAGRQLPVPGAAAMALDRDAMHGVLQLFAGDGEVRAAGAGELLAVDQDEFLLRGRVDRALVDRPAGRVAQPAQRVAVRVVAPQAQHIAGAQRRAEVIGQLELEVVLAGVVLGARADQSPGLVGAVQPCHRAADRRADGAGACGGRQPGGEGQRLALAVGAVQVQPPAEVAGAVADRGAGRPGAVGRLLAVELGGLGAGAQLGIGLEPRRHAGLVVHHRADRVAGVCGRERPVHHVHPLDFLGRHQPPARREAQAAHAVAQVVGQQDAVGVDRRAGAVAGARGAAGQDGVVVVADVALAHQQAGQVLERVFRVGGVDRALDVLAGDGLAGGRDVGG
mmetsp:Transcript_65310/g.154269  ORF Transcript_65310/g.154269 Transcript_65310/m.154269 type:complete len:388 (-) Transcript_65310:1738-2901(-)